MPNEKVMSMNLCEKCNKVVDFIRYDNKNGVYVKVCQCPQCKELYAFLPTREDGEMYDG